MNIKNGKWKTTKSFTLMIILEATLENPSGRENEDFFKMILSTGNYEILTYPKGGKLCIVVVHDI